MILPPPLHRGDRIALVSPAYRLVSEKIIHAADILSSWGLDPVLPDTEKQPFRGFYSDRPEARLKELVQAFRDPTVRAVICTRGGYGTLHLMPLLPDDLFTADPKWLVGFSDITTLHAGALLQGVASIHGPMGSTFGEDPESDRALLDLLFGTLPVYRLPADPRNRPGTAAGTLVGGNLATLAPLLGTEFDPCPDGMILFIEEVEETFHNIDRLWNMLDLHGALRKVRGLILGDFTECTADLDYATPEEMIGTYADRLGVPVLYGFPAGHGVRNLPLVHGATVKLTVTETSATVDFKL